MDNKTSRENTGKKVSIIIPVYNEENTILEIVDIVKAVKLPEKIVSREIILIDDCSTDGTQGKIENLGHNDNEVKVFRHKKNMGKGAALNTGFKKVTGDIVIIQDADMEYNPNEYSKLLSPILENKADVVYGSRYANGEVHRILYFWHSKMNQYLTLLSNIFSDLDLSDMETCYKVFKVDVLKKIKIEEDRFGFEPEITAKLGEFVRSGDLKMYEVGISYDGRTSAEGKKIGWRDGVHALWCILKYNTSTFAYFVKYAIIGTFVAISQIITMVALVVYFSFDTSTLINTAYVISMVISLVVAFILHSKMTWRYKFTSKLDLLKKIGQFFGVVIFSVSARIAIFFMLNEFGVNYKLNLAIGLVVMVIINFFGYGNIVFNKLSNK